MTGVEVVPAALPDSGMSRSASGRGADCGNRARRPKGLAPAHFRSPGDWHGFRSDSAVPDTAACLEVPRPVRNRT
jgi:hypothetical protein